MITAPRIFWLATVATLVALTSCEKRAVRRGIPQSLDVSAIPFFVEEISPRIVSPGADITVTGYLFAEDLQAKIADTDVEIKSRTDTKVVLVAPDFGDLGGVFDLALGNDDVGRSFKIGIDPIDNLPLYSGNLDEICQDQTVINAAGEIVRGLRDCDAKLEPSAPVVIQPPPAVEGIPACTINGQSDCIVSGERISLDRSSLSPLIIAEGSEIGGVVGSAKLLAGPCVQDGQTDCTTDAEFPAINSSSLIPENIRAGRSLGGVIGAQKYCKNGVNRNAHNTNGPSGSALEGDIYDTIDDQGAKMGEIDESPFGDDFVCNGTNSWKALEPDGSLGGPLSCDGPTDKCIFVDVHTQIIWTELLPGFSTWAEAAEKCALLDWGGISEWRLPTQKEALQAYIDGIEQLTQSSPNFGLNGSAVWTATSLSAQTGTLNHNTAAWSVYLDKGLSNPVSKTGNAKVRCIADVIQTQ